ncbi:MAG: hypothetical protein C5B49_09385 [Bdellovibrio sp.]|nr:MAG: hypothetical protein C5B49_09385 [Bdellovibrio sp.]
MLLVSFSARAWIEFAESGDVLPRGTYKLGGGPQFRMSELPGFSGTNSAATISTFMEGGIRDDLGWRATLGAGDLGFFLGGGMKWIPFPDYENQPAMGLRADVNFGKKNDSTLSAIRVAPLISKGVQTELVTFVPYAALPLGLASVDSTSSFMMQLALGSDIKPDAWKTVMFNVELGANITKAFSYLSINAFYLFDGGAGFKIRRK